MYFARVVISLESVLLMTNSAHPIQLFFAVSCDVSTKQTGVHGRAGLS